MSPERWSRVEAILGEALEQDPSQRAAFLDKACGHDQDLRSEVEGLLAYESHAGQAIAGAVDSAAGFFDPDQLGFAEGDRIGPYRVVREAGRGGMGTVYLAERADDQFRKRVAIKVVTVGMDTAAVLGRFRHERQILARLEHPYIARLLDGGSTEEGRPYLVMEHVEGKPITRYCSELQLGAKARIELFRKVCAAVQNAHQNLIVHRDLKPDNILVDGEGNPRLLDFGIAKLLDPDDAPQFTVMAGGSQMLTPDYASPEQVRGEPITTASDVYALGVILYELMAGVRPHRLERYTRDEIERAVCLEDPERPSTAWRRAMGRGDTAHPPLLKSGDLDNIILMAMQKDPSRRYGSVAELSEDLHRYLEGLPVRAREDTLAYRIRKFVGRNRTGVAVAALLLATLSGGVAVSAMEARRAQRRFNEVRRIAHAVLYDVHDAISDLQGSTKAREVVVGTALQYLDGLAKEAAGDPGIQLELAEAYQRVGDVQGHAIARSLGRTLEALDSYRKAMMIADELGARHPDNKKANLLRMGVRERIAAIQAHRAMVDEALARFREGEQIGEAAAQKDPADLENLRSLASLYVADCREQTDNARALAACRKAVDIMERVVAAKPGEDDRADLASAYAALNQVLGAAKKRDEALDAARKAVRISEGLVAEHPMNARHRRNLGIEYAKVADSLRLTTPTPKEAAEALEYQHKSLDILAALAAADPADHQAANEHAMALWSTERVMPQDKDHQAGLELLRQSASILHGLIASDPEDSRLRRNLAGVYMFMGIRQTKAGDKPGAGRSLHEAIRTAEELARQNPKDVIALNYVWRSDWEMTDLAASLGNRADVTEANRKMIEAAQSARAIDASNPFTLSWLPLAYSAAGGAVATLAESAPAERRRLEWAQAQDYYQKAIAAWEQLPAGKVGTVDRDDRLAKARTGAARCAAALARLR